MVAEAASNLENTDGLNIMFLFFIFLNSYLVSALDEFLTICSWFKKCSGMLLSLCDFNTILLREQICVFQSKLEGVGSYRGRAPPSSSPGLCHQAETSQTGQMSG